MTQFSSRPPVVDTLTVRRSETWVGVRPVTLVRGNERISGGRQGRFGGVIVYRPDRDIDFGPDRGHRVWSRGAFAELPDEEWEQMGWTIVRQYNPTNLVLGDLRDYWKHHGTKLTAYHAAAYLTICDYEAMDVPADHIDHARKVLTRLDAIAKMEAAA